MTTAEVGILITRKCNFSCDHCMFSCGNSRGDNMSDETIKEVKRFLDNNKKNIHHIHFFGGEPFVNVEHFDKCFNAFYDKTKGFFVSTNGTFLRDKNKLLYVKNLIKNYAKYNEQNDFAIGISSTSYHRLQWSKVLKTYIEKIKRVLQYPEDYQYEFPYLAEDDDPIAFEVGDYIPSPFEGKNERNQTYLYFRRSSEDDLYDMNPSGRALKNKIYGKNRRCYCVLTSKKEVGEQDFYFNFFENGDIGICCNCACGTVGNVRDVQTIEDVIERIKKFKEIIKSKIEINNDTKMIDLCPECKKINLAKGTI